MGMRKSRRQFLRPVGINVDLILGLLYPRSGLRLESDRTLAAIKVASAGAFGLSPVYRLARKHLESEVIGGRVLCLASSGASMWLACLGLPSKASIHYPRHPPIPLRGPSATWTAIDSCPSLSLRVSVRPCAASWLGSNARRCRGVRDAVRGLTLVPHSVIGAAGAESVDGCVAHIIVPAFSGEASMFYDLYTGVGSSPQGVLRTLVHDPGTVVSALFGADDVQYLVLIIPTAGLCLLSPGLLLVATPQLVANGLSSECSATDPRLHLVSVIVPFVIAATVLGIRRLPPQAQGAGAVTVLALCAGISFGSWTMARFEHNRWVGGKPSAAHLAAVREAIALVPNDAPVSTTNRAGAYLSGRRVIYSAPIVRDSSWVLLDLDDPWLPVRGRDAWVPSTGRRCGPSRAGSAAVLLGSESSASTACSSSSGRWVETRARRRPRRAGSRRSRPWLRPGRTPRPRRSP